MIKHQYFVHLDLLRVFFVFIVLLHHWLAENPFAFLPFGSTIAFVLSGFLLTIPLLEAKKDQANYWRTAVNFLARRLLRTLPIYLLVILLYIILNRHNFREYSVYFLTFTQNYLIALNKTRLIPFLQTWSLAVQEQFYLFLPIAIYLLPYKYLKTLFIIFSIAGLLFRLWYFYLGLPFSYNHLSTECCLDCFGIGALLAYYHYDHPDQLKRLLSNKLLLYALVLAYLGSTLGYSTNVVNGDDKNSSYLFNNLYRITERTFVSLFSIWFIAWGIYFPSQKLNKVSSNIIINYLSKISYGIFIYHFAVGAVISKTISFLFNLPLKSIQFAWWAIGFYFTFTILLSIISYELIEKPILQLKNKYFGNSLAKIPAANT